MKTRKEIQEETENDMIIRGLDRKYDYPGVYSISIGNKIVYIGKSRNMLHRIAQHISYILIPDNSNKYFLLHAARKSNLTIKFDVIYRLTADMDQNTIDQAIGVKEGEAIRKEKPLLNYQIPNEEDYHTYTVNRSAKKLTFDELLVAINEKK